MPFKSILLIEDDPDYEKLIRNILAACGEAFEVEAAPDLASGLALIERYPPDLILVDLNLPDSAGYETFLKVRECSPNTPIVVLTGVDNDHVAFRAVEDGAQDYLVKSLIQPRLIARCVRMAMSRQKWQATTKSGAPVAPGPVLSFIGCKGGVGTSTTAVNVAALLVQNGFETVMMELQHGRPGSLSLYLQGRPRYGLDALIETPAVAITPSCLSQCLDEVLPGLQVLCPLSCWGDTHTVGAEHVRAMIAAARRVCRVVVLDLPGHIDEGVAEALKLSDSITMVVDREWASVHCAAAFAERIKKAASSGCDVGLVVVDRTGLEAPPTLEDIKKPLKMHPLAIIPSAANAVALSHVARTPLVLLYPDDCVSLAHFELAERILSSATQGSFHSGGTRRPLHRNVSRRAIPETTYS